jgi:hypothetical protein
MKHKCINCVYSLAIDDVDYECRRYAPRRVHGVGAGESTTKFPTVRFDDWCGEFYPKESGLQIPITTANYPDARMGGSWESEEE